MRKLYIVNPKDMIFHPNSRVCSPEGDWISNFGDCWVLDPKDGHVSRYTQDELKKVSIRFDDQYPVWRFKPFINNSIAGFIHCEATQSCVWLDIKHSSWKIWQSTGVIYLNSIILFESETLHVNLRVGYIFVEGAYVFVRLMCRTSYSTDWLSLVFTLDGEFVDISILSGETVTLRYNKVSVFRARMLMAGREYKY